MRDVIEGERVFVYWNVHKRVFSVRDTKCKVIAHMSKVSLDDALFVVQKSGRDKVLRDGVKNVHAGVRGSYTSLEKSTQGSTGITYNPYRTGSFVTRKYLIPITSSKSAILTSVLDDGIIVPRVYGRGIIS